MAATNVWKLAPHRCEIKKSGRPTWAESRRSTYLHACMHVTWARLDSIDCTYQGMDASLHAWSSQASEDVRWMGFYAFSETEVQLPRSGQRFTCPA